VLAKGDKSHAAFSGGGHGHGTHGQGGHGQGGHGH
jgi:hypothetical protein